MCKQTRRFNWIEEKLKFMAFSLKKAINSKIEVQKRYNPSKLKCLPKCYVHLLSKSRKTLSGSLKLLLSSFRSSWSRLPMVAIINMDYHKYKLF